MHAITHSSAASFLDAVEPLLLARAARHNLILGVATTARDAGIYEELRAWHVELDGVARASALHTPPFRIVAGAARPLRIPALREGGLETASVSARGVGG